MVARYDISLGNTMSDFDPDQPIPDLWAQFDALAAVPVMVIRGALSDLLSPETVVLMREAYTRHSRCSKYPIRVMRRCCPNRRS